MKKVITMSIAFLLIVCMSVSALATGEFLNSPSTNPAPDLESGSAESGTAEIIITSYAERTNLSAEAQAAMEEAYNDIKSAGNLAELVPALETIAEAAGIDITDLAVSDLFDVTDTGDGSGTYTITLKADTLANFVALLHMKDGVWEIVENATVSGGFLSFSVDGLSPFAIVVKTSAGNGGGTTDTPATGDNSSIVWLAAIAAASAAAILFCVVKTKAHKAR